MILFADKQAIMPHRKLRQRYDLSKVQSHVLVPTLQLLGDNHHVTSLNTPLVRGHHIVANPPIMLQRAEAFGLQSCIVHIDIASVLTRDEAVTTPIIEPFYSALHNTKVFNDRSKLYIFLHLCNTKALKIGFYL